MKMSDRKDYHRKYYQDTVKLKRAQEKEAYAKLPELLQDLRTNTIRMQILQAENSELRTRLQEQEERLAILTIQNEERLEKLILENEALKEECIEKTKAISSLTRYSGVNKSSY